MLYSLEVFLSLKEVKEVIVVCDPAFKNLLKDYPVRFALPGNRRQDSLYHGFLASNPSTNWICVHDAARPFITKEQVLRLFKEGSKIGAATLGMPVKATIKTVNLERLVDNTLERSKVWEIQTPQLLSRPLLQKGFEKALKENITVTDDVSLAELIEHPVKLVEGAYTNIKITTPEDLLLANTFLAHV